MERQNTLLTDGNFGSRVLLPIFVCLAGMVGVASICTSANENPLPIIMRWGGLVMVVAACVFPRAGMFILIAACAYLDLVKRLAYYYGGFSVTLQIDILSFAPYTLAGIFLGMMVPRFIVRKRFVYRHEIVPMLVAAGVILGSFLVSYRSSHNLIEAVTNSAQVGLYTILLFVVPDLFRTREEIEKVLKAILVIFLPVALWGIYQGLFGYPEVDRVWLASPLTINGSLLGDEKPRAFGTLASPHPFGIVYWLAILSAYFLWAEERRKAAYLFALFVNLAALFFGYVRSFWITLFLAFGTIFFFQNARRAVLLYGMTGALFILVVINAKNIDLGALQSYAPVSSDNTDMAFRLGTYTERLYSFQNWTSDPRFWTPFGIRDDGHGQLVGSDQVIHDQIGQILVSAGFVGLAAALLVIATGLFYFHRMTFQLADPNSRRLAIVLLAMIFSLLYSGSLSGSSLQIFPWNFFFWFATGCLLSLCNEGADKDATGAENDEGLSAKPIWKAEMGRV